MAGDNGFVPFKESSNLIQIQPDGLCFQLYIDPNAFGRFLYRNGLVIIRRKFTQRLCLVCLLFHNGFSKSIPCPNVSHSWLVMHFREFTSQCSCDS